MKKYLLDTNHVANAIGKISPLRDRIRRMRRQGLKFGTCWPVLFEVEVGIVQTRDPAGCRRHLKILLSEVRIRPLDWNVMEEFGKVHLLLKQRGRVVSLVDKTLAALAMHENATILTSDLDFQALPEVRTENWLA